MAGILEVGTKRIVEVVETLIEDHEELEMDMALVVLVMPVVVDVLDVLHLLQVEIVENIAPISVVAREVQDDVIEIYGNNSQEG